MDFRWENFEMSCVRSSIGRRQYGQSKHLYASVPAVLLYHERVIDSPGDSGNASRSNTRLTSYSASVSLERYDPNCSWRYSLAPYLVRSDQHWIPMDNVMDDFDVGVERWNRTLS